MAAMVPLLVSASAELHAEVLTPRADQAQTDVPIPLPVTAGELMPLEARRDVYLVTEGADQGLQVPVTFEPHADHWILTQQGVAQHELHRDRQGNLLIDRETDLRQDRQIDYGSPILLLPATVEGTRSWTGHTPVSVRSTRTRSVKYRGACTWQLEWRGVGPVETPGGTVPAYRLRATREIRLPLAQISMTIDFEYVRGLGMIATGIDQVVHALGLFTERERWRLERMLAL